jgi:acetyl esterase/lipase
VDPDPVLPAKVLTIQWGKDPQQTVTLYMPARRASERVAIFLLFHGGGWWQGDPDAPNVVDAKVSWLNPQGIAFASGGYRLGTRSTPKITPDMEAEDVADLVAYLRAHADELGIDMKRFVLAGHSAGGELTAEAITTLCVEATGYLGLDTACYSVKDAMKLNIRDPDLARIYKDAWGSDPAFWAKWDPLGNMKSAPPPMLLACSTKRGKANTAQANAFAGKARTFGVEAEVIEVDLEHGEMNSMLGRTDTPEAAAYTAKAMAFVRECIGNG